MSNDKVNATFHPDESYADRLARESVEAAEAKHATDPPNPIQHLDERDAPVPHAHLDEH